MSKTYMIAEAGVNHNGSLELAKRLVDVASEAGADAVKFQTFKADRLVSPSAPKAEYQKRACGDGSQYEMLKRLELSSDAHLELKEHCAKRGIEFLSTPFDESAARFLHSIGVTTFKISSGSVTDYPLLREVNGFGAKVFLSTGMATLAEIGEALDVLTRCDVTLLHCTTEYPCPYECANLHVMKTMRKRFGLPVGYSDHTQGLEISIAAVALGAEVLEKHVTLDRGMSGPDHKASIEPDELKRLVVAIRNVEASLGNGEKILSPGEIKNMAVARKSIHASCFIRKGTVFSEDNLIAKRPGTGCSPMLWNEVIGKIAQRDYNIDEMISVDLS